MDSIRNKDWFENDTFWEQYAPVMFDPARWAEAPGVAAAINKIAGLNSKSKVLDAGCGPGRVAVEIALLGCQVTGVDLVQSYLDAADESARDEGVKIDFVKADLRDFVRPDTFDTALSLYTSFGYCKSREEDLHILKNINASLKKDGWFIIECLSKEIAVKNFVSGEWFERNGLTVLTDYSVEGAWEGLVNKWTIIKPDGTRIDHTFVQRLYAATEFRELLFSAGFSSVEIYGDFEFSPFNENAVSCVLICRKG